MSNGTAEVDLELLDRVMMKGNNFLRDLHYPSIKETMELDPNGKPKKIKITSRFRYTFQRTTWSSQILEQLESQLQKDTKEYNVYKFTTNMNHNQLLSTYILQRLDKVVMKKKYQKNYRMCYTHNIPHAEIEKATLIQGTKSQDIEDVWLDIYSQFYMKPGFEHHYNRMIGNIPSLQDWSSTFLPRYELILPLPWSYSRHECTSIPLHLCSLTPIKHIFKMRNKLSKLIRMQKRSMIDGEIIWNNVPFKNVYVTTNTDNIPTPELWGFYSRQTSNEIRDAHKTNIHNIHNIYGEDIQVFRSKKSYNLDPTVDIHVPIETTYKTSAKAMFWVAQNQEAHKFNSHANYSTNSNDFTKGINPIRSMTMESGGMKRYEDLGSVHTELAQAWYKFPSAPREPGYNGLSFGWDTTSLHADVGIILHDNKINTYFKLGYSDYYSDIISNDALYDSDDSISDDEDSLSDELDNSDLFKICVVLLVMNRVEYSSNKAHVITGFEGSNL